MSGYRPVIVQLSSGYRPIFIWLSSGYHPVIVLLSSSYHPVIVQLSSSYRPVIFQLSSGYHPVIVWLSFSNLPFIAQLCTSPSNCLLSNFIKLFEASLQCEFIRTFLCKYFNVWLLWIKKLTGCTISQNRIQIHGPYYLGCQGRYVTRICVWQPAILWLAGNFNSEHNKWPKQSIA